MNSSLKDATQKIDSVYNKTTRVLSSLHNSLNEVDDVIENSKAVVDNIYDIIQKVCLTFFSNSQFRYDRDVSI